MIQAACRIFRDRAVLRHPRSERHGPRAREADQRRVRQGRCARRKIAVITIVGADRSCRRASPARAPPGELAVDPPHERAVLPFDRGCRIQPSLEIRQAGLDHGGDLRRGTGALRRRHGERGATLPPDCSKRRRHGRKYERHFPARIAAVAGLCPLRDIAARPRRRPTSASRPTGARSCRCRRAVRSTGQGSP